MVSKDDHAVPQNIRNIQISQAHLDSVLIVKRVSSVYQACIKCVLEPT